MKKMIMTNHPQNPIGQKIQDFELGNVIGSGGFAKVFEATCMNIGYEKFKVAIKRINKEDIKKRKFVKRVVSEIQIHSQLKNPTAVKFYTSFEDEKFIYLVLELCKQGSLDKYIKKNGPLSEEEACYVIKEVIEGIRYLHSNYIVHRDLSLRNVLLTDSIQKNGKIKIADFGMAAQLKDSDDKKYTVLGTANFMSPEVVQRQPYDSKVDCWGVGCILYALLYGTPPFDDKNKKCHEIMKDTVMSDLKFPSHASAEAMHLLRGLLEKDSERRMNIHDALKSSFIKKYDTSLAKKSGFSQRNGDSGMCSSSSSASLGSRSAVKTYHTDDSAQHSFGSDSRNLTTRVFNSVPLDLHQLHHDEYTGQCYGRSAPRHCSEQENCKPREERQRSKSPKVHKNDKSNYMNQLKNKIQSLPSHQDIGRVVPSKPVNFDSRVHRQFDGSRRWEQLNVCPNKPAINPCPKLTYFPAFYQEERFESHVEDTHIRSHAESPFPYPSHHLQNITENERCSYTDYSTHNTIEMNVHNANMCRNNNGISITNSQDYASNCSCSHDQYCAPENTCSHRIGCCCQYNAPSAKNRQNTFHLHNGCKRDNRNGIELILEENHKVEKSLKDIIDPLTTIRLPPKRLEFKNVIASILDNGQVCLEFIKLKRNKKIISSVCFISPNGLTIHLHKPKKNVSATSEPPPLANLKDVQHFSFENLPEKHWKKYQRAKDFIDIVRAKTAKIILYGKDAKCVMMENGPNPDYEMHFYNGWEIFESGKGLTCIDQNGRKFSKLDVTIENQAFIWNIFVKMKEECKLLEESAPDIFFPIISRRMPHGVGKENVTNRSLHSSALNGAISILKSVTISTDCSPCSNSFQNSRSISLQNESSPLKNINEILQNLRSLPKIKNKKVLAEYKDGINMWISKDGQDVNFYNTHTRNKLTSKLIEQNPEIIRRFKYDSPSILIYVLSKEEEK